MALQESARDVSARTDFLRMERLAGTHRILRIIERFFSRRPNLA
ncbi:MAG: hypothetical protein OJF51_000722 [Nitrospira sp.]|nr:MAG: hypothetical protein OJF51_000722 [Nitrospira sp.]